VADEPAFRPSGFYEQVFDLADAGPRHRFTVRAPGGEPFIVHNCTQAVARDIMKHGMRRAEAAGYPPILPVHDEVIVEVPEKFGSFDEFKALMLSPPEWADGLPVAGDGFVARRYRK
jgi:hypothetical protein